MISDEDLLAHVRDLWFRTPQPEPDEVVRTIMLAGSPLRLTAIIEIAARRVRTGHRMETQFAFYRRWPGDVRELLKRTTKRSDAEDELERWRAAGAKVEHLKPW